MIQLQGWAAQIKECKQSGQTVKQWCKENGISLKTYYNHLKRVREEMLETIESKKALPVGDTSLNCMPGTQSLVDTYNSKACLAAEKPHFAKFKVPPTKESAVTVWLGDCIVEIHNGAEDSVIEQVLRVVVKL